MKLGRKFRLTPAQQAKVRERQANGVTMVDIARSFNISRTKQSGAQSPSLIYPVRGDEARRIARFYRMLITPNLFGQWTLFREWGRIGSGGQVQLDHFDNAGLPFLPCRSLCAPRNDGNMKASDAVALPRVPELTA